MGFTWASRGLVDVKPREQITCNPHFESEIKLERWKLNSNSQFLINSQRNNTSRAKALSTGGNCYDSSLWVEGFK